MTNIAMEPVGRAAHAVAVRDDVRRVATVLQAVLGRDVVAVLAGRDPRQVSRWVSGAARPPARETQLLRDVYQIVRTLADVEDDEVVRAWFMGMNPQLDDEAPMLALAAGRTRDVMAAARAFVNAG